MAIKKSRSVGLAKAIAAAKTITALTAKLNKMAVRPERKLTVQAVAQWIDVPPDRCIGVEAATGVSRYELRPDIYGKGPGPLESRVA